MEIGIDGTIKKKHKENNITVIDEIKLNGVSIIEKRQCRICGCTDENCRQCIEAWGYPCS